LLEIDSGDNADVLFLVEDLAVEEVGVDGLFEFGESGWGGWYLPESMRVLR
jgi:hypothetical protein